MSEIRNRDEYLLNALSTLKVYTNQQLMHVIRMRVTRITSSGPIWIVMILCNSKYRISLISSSRVIVNFEAKFARKYFVNFENIYILEDPIILVGQ